MNRTLRNGLAVAGMAGGMLFLGQAVASADQTATAGNDVEQAAASETGSGGDSGAGNANFSDASATNVKVTAVSTDVDGGDGGTNTAVINTGVVSDGSGGGSGYKPAGHENDGKTVVDFDSGDVAVHQDADGGDVEDSGNVSVAGGGDQTAKATND
ncbi:MAG TPA: hypothetical protein VE463_15435, partial [Blastococcus sp.]|nr:hypothetical protein [Blastococcus sp.]